MFDVSFRARDGRPLRRPALQCIGRALCGAPLLVLALPAASLATSARCERIPSLADVLARVEHAPRAEAARSDTEAERELARQAGARPNPEMKLELEDFTGSESFYDFGQSQTTLSFAQKIELGGVRDRRVDAAEREGDAVAARGAAELAQAAAGAKQRYIELAAAADSLAAAAEAERLARAFLTDAEKRGAAAAASEADVARARVAVSSAELHVAGKRRDVAIAAERLSAAWGGTASDAACHADAAMQGVATSSGVARVGAMLPAVPRTAAIPPDASRAPAVAAAEAEVEAMRADVALARASAAPDLELGAGLRYHAYNQVSAVAELRVEVPIFDRNEGGIAAAERKLSAAQSRALAVRRETEARLERMRRTLEAAAARERTIAVSMIPSAESAVAALSRAWQGGAASTFEMLEARRAVLELRQDRIEAASEYYRAVAALEAVTGTVTPTLGGAPAPRTED